MFTGVRLDSRQLFWGLLFLLIGFRLLLLVQYILQDPFARVLLLDARVYDSWARTIAQGDWWGKEVFYQAPLYPYFLALLYLIWGEDHLVVYVVQAVLSIGTALLFYQVGKAYFDRQTGRVAALLALGFGFYAFYSLKFLPTTLALFLVLLLLWQLRRSEQHPTWSNWFLSGLLTGLATLVRPSLLLLVVLLLLWLLFVPASWRLSFRYGSAFLVGVLLCIVPVAGRNFWIERDLVLIAANGGETFYQGTNPRAQGTYTPVPALSTHITEQRVLGRQVAEEALGRPLSRREVSQYWWKQGFRYIREHPLSYLVLLGKKFYLALSGKDVSLIYFARFEQERFLPLLRVFVVNQYLLLPFALTGLFSMRREHFWLLAFLGVQLFTLLLFYVSTRYRLLLTPAIILWAGKGLVDLPVLLRKPQVRVVLLAALLGALASFVFDQRTPYARADQHHNLGIVYNTLGRYKEAIPELVTALRYRPSSPAILTNLGFAYYHLGKYRQAIQVWQQARRLAPASLPLAYNLAIAYEQVDQEQAIHHLRAYVQAAQSIATEQRYVQEARQRLRRLEAKR
ncbi:MAG: tetratricopeptide repeat protein [Nitrospinota bacterium]|nr:MAG: tetratricopeptide repeat protein [Nitrospinota bacterium]